MITSIINFTSSARFTLTDEAKQDHPEFDNCVLGIIDQCRSWTKYAPVSADAAGNIIPDLQHARTFFDDEVQPV